MAKKNVMTSIDSELHDKAKEALLNVSGITEWAIKQKLNQKEVIVQTDVENCEFCGREEQKATAKNLNGMCWLENYRQWICTTCLRDKVKEIKRSKN